MEVDIRTLDDVLPFIEGKDEIYVNHKDGYTVVDYATIIGDVFDTDMALQCRGLKFDPDGRILARPLQKFFNLGEKEDPLHLDWSRPHHILDKLDGTMIHPAILDGETVLMTRAGVTEHAGMAQAEASDATMALCREQLNAGFTPVFEFTSPENRIVIEYDRPALTLLAVRHTVSGKYLGDGDLRDLAERYGIDAVTRHGRVDDIQTFLGDTRALQDVEGFVIAFEDGHRVKIKADRYVLRHRALSDAHREKNVLIWVLEDMVDDVIPLLSPEMADRVTGYQTRVRTTLKDRTEQVQDFVESHRDLDRKSFALAAREVLDKSLMSAAFAAIDGKDVDQAVKSHLAWASRSQPRIDSVREVYGLTWTPVYNSGVEVEDP